MTKYEPLNQFLGRLKADYWRPTFLELERILEFKLPAGARKSAAWWEKNSGNSRHTNAWTAAGWKVDGVDLEKSRVTFIRTDAAPAPVPNGAALEGLTDRLRGRAEALRERAGISGRRAVDGVKQHPYASAGVSAGVAFAAGVGLGFLLYRSLSGPASTVATNAEDRARHALALFSEGVHDLMDTAGERFRSLRG